ncbi:MAG TPA: DUF6378 domain-containing protein, partial [Candidatus Angelobacter sp.]|nr:DUF6378 domain-containing protein [Candidatus Angelobacter sp.]
EQVSILLVLLKVAREANEHSRDNIVDIAGYARVREMLDEEENKINDKISKDGLDIYRGVGPGRQLRVEGQLIQNEPRCYAGQTIPGGSSIYTQPLPGTAVQHGWTSEVAFDNPTGELVWRGVSGATNGLGRTVRQEQADGCVEDVEIQYEHPGVPA